MTAPSEPGVLATADGGLAALEGCDVVVKTPGLSRYRPEVAQLTARGIPVSAVWACGSPSRTCARCCA